jgi:hypothetical protein
MVGKTMRHSRFQIPPANLELPPIESLHEQIHAVTSARANWLEDVLAGLLINGVEKSEIEIQERPENRTVVAVRGMLKYEWKFEARA